jgi:hypothetical protein
MTLDKHIQYKERFNQFQSFANLRFGAFRPIDIDGFMEIQNKLFIFIESKSSDAPISRGQELALERLTDAIAHDPKKQVFTLIARHFTPADEAVDTGNSLVHSYRHNGQWVEVSELNYTVRDFIEQLINTYIYNTK